MAIRLQIPPAPAEPVAAPVVEHQHEPVVYQCVNPQCRLFYREAQPHRWQCDTSPRFDNPVRIEDLIITAIEARGHVLVPLRGGA